MDLEFKKKIEERFKEIPEVLAKAIKSSGWEGIVFDIGRKHALHVDTIGDLQNELILVLTGITHPDEFHRIVIQELGIPEDKADVVIEEINNQVNEKIKNELKVVLGQEEISDEKIDEGERINNSERNVLHESGIRLGDEPNEIESPVVVTNNESPKTKLESAPNTNLPKAETKKIAEPTVFKTRISPTDLANADKSFIDPYREPVE